MDINYDRAMIDLVREIRRYTSTDLKPNIKLANPNLMHELAQFYHLTEQVIAQALIRDLFNRAGEKWLYLLDNDKPSPTLESHVYRGQVSHHTVNTAPDKPTEKPVRMYRGQPVYN